MSRPVIVGASPRIDRASAVAAAARNNAQWCDAVCRSHGLPGVFSEHAWTNPRRTPPFYPDAVTLAAAADPAEILSAIDTTPGAGVKDSFACLDLSADAFDVLFEAQWILRDAPRPARGVARWERVGDPDPLERWEEAWAGADGPRGLFRPELLEEPDVVFVGCADDGGMAAGAVLSRSRAVVGVSNLFAADGDLEAAWTGCLGAVAEHAPRTPVVGYEAGGALASAHAAGFSAIGPLRVWSRSGCG